MADVSILKGGVWMQTCTLGKRYMIKGQRPGDASTRQGTPRNASKLPEDRREGWNRLPLTDSDGTNLKTL